LNRILGFLAQFSLWFGLSATSLLIGFLSISTARVLGRSLGRWGWRLRPGDRQLACENLLHLGASLGERTRTRIARRCFEQMGETVLELISLGGKDVDRLGPPPRPGGVAIAGLDALREKISALRESGSGVIIISGHIGSWELAGSIIGREYPHDSLFMARKYDNPVEQQWLDTLRRRLGARLVYQDESLLRSIRLLHSGGILGLMTDLDIKKMDGIHVPFLGKWAHTTTAPARLAMKTGSPLFPLFVIRDAQGYHLEFDDLIEPAQFQGEDEEQIRAITVATNEAIERAIRRHPAQWPWMHARWHSTPEVVARRKLRHSLRSVEGEVRGA